MNVAKWHLDNVHRFRESREKEWQLQVIAAVQGSDERKTKMLVFALFSAVVLRFVQVQAGSIYCALFGIDWPTDVAKSALHVQDTNDHAGQ